MQRHLSRVQTMPELFRIHSWMKKAFSSLNVTPQEAIDHFQTLIKYDFLNKLFDPEDAKKILNDLPWIFHEFKEHPPITIKEIYMLFYTSIVSQTAGTEPTKVKKDILIEMHCFQMNLHIF